MKRLGWIAGLGVAGLLVAGIPAQAQSGSTTGSQSTEDQTKGSGSTTSQGTGSAGDTSTMGSGSTTSQGTGSAGDTSTMGSGSATGSSMGMESSKNELTGTVQKFDRETKELTLANSDKKLKVSDTTTVTKDGQAGTLSDIKEGEQVRASFSGTGDTLQVSQIEVMTAGTTGTGTSGMGTGSTGTTTPPADTGTGSTGSGTTTTPPADTGTTKTPDSGSSGATPPPSKGY